MQKTLVLAVPPQAGLLEGFSSGVISLANYVHLHNDDTRVIFADFGPVSARRLSESVEGILKGAVGPVFVGITGTTADYQNMLRTAEAFKTLDPTVVTIFGGHHATAQDDVVLRRHPIVDFVIRGEGEAALSSFLRHYDAIDLVPSISFRSGGGIARTPEARLLDQNALDKISPTIDFDELRSPPGKFDRITYVSARGCPLKCFFCSVRDSTIRAKSVPVVVRDLRHFVELGYRSIAIEDNFFAHQPRRTLELCAGIELLQKDSSFVWDCQTRVESMRRSDVVAAMAHAKCDAVNLGVESLIADQLQFLGKTSRPRPYLEMLRHEVIPQIMRAGMGVNINLQLGIPGETQFHRESTLSELARLGEVARQYGREVVVHPQLHVIYPGTPHFENSVAAGIFGKVGSEIFEEFTPWEAANAPVLEYLGEHFAHGTGGLPVGILESEALRHGEFKIAECAIATLTRQLVRMRDIPGISVFQYGAHLAMAS
jgi:anaerobic magnesium-protoporphyrin IX monomethyl ester cyclase